MRGKSRAPVARVRTEGTPGRPRVTVSTQRRNPAARCSRPKPTLGRGHPFGFPDEIFRTIRTQDRVRAARALYEAGGNNRDDQHYPHPAEWEANMAHSREWKDLRLALRACSAF
jgi:hypothetical protein